MAQVTVFAIALTLVYAVPPQHWFSAELLGVWLEPNLVLIALNLLPIHPFDGGEAWKLFGHLRRRRAKRHAQRPAARPPPPPRPERGETADDDPLLAGGGRDVEALVRGALERAQREARESKP